MCGRPRQLVTCVKKHKEGRVIEASGKLEFSQSILAPMVRHDEESCCAPANALKPVFHSFLSPSFIFSLVMRRSLSPVIEQPTNTRPVIEQSTNIRLPNWTHHPCCTSSFWCCLKCTAVVSGHRKMRCARCPDKSRKAISASNWTSLKDSSTHCAHEGNSTDSSGLSPSI